MMHDALWGELETDARRITGSGILKRMLAPDAACTMFLGVQRPQLNRVFLLQVPRNLLPSRDQIPESQGFELTVQITGEEAPTHATIVLCSNAQSYNEVFTAMADNLYQRLKECKDEKQIVHLFLDRLNQWQQFFEINGIDGLGEDSQRGLYGELYFLKEHVLTLPENFVTEISAWTGPKNRQHDFQFGKTAIEVKTCVAKQHQKLWVASEQQLDETLVEHLFLFHLSVSSLENHKDTLPALIAEIRQLLSTVHTAAAFFEESLVKRGYLDSQAWRYEKTGYVVRESNVFRVSGDFPRLTERDLPPGVGDLTYSIGVSECKHFAVSIADLVFQIHEGTP